MPSTHEIQTLLIKFFSQDGDSRTVYTLHKLGKLNGKRFELFSSTHKRYKVKNIHPFVDEYYSDYWSNEMFRLKIYDRLEMIDWYQSAYWGLFSFVVGNFMRVDVWMSITVSYWQIWRIIKKYSSCFFLVMPNSISSEQKMYNIN